MLIFHTNEAFKLSVVILLMGLSLMQVLLPAYSSSKNGISLHLKLSRIIPLIFKHSRYS
jgi:hypothetical protein